MLLQTRLGALPAGGRLVNLMDWAKMLTLIDQKHVKAGGSLPERAAEEAGGRSHGWNYCADCDVGNSSQSESKHFGNHIFEVAS